MYLQVRSVYEPPSIRPPLPRAPLQAWAMWPLRARGFAVANALQDALSSMDVSGSFLAGSFG